MKQRFDFRKLAAIDIVFLGYKLVLPALADDTVLKPTLSWELLTDKPRAISAEFSYVTGGMNWEASYNVIAPPKSNVLELVGWVTLDNQSGKTCRDAHLKLMAGDVNKVPPPRPVVMGSAGAAAFGVGGGQFGPPVTEKTFPRLGIMSGMSEGSVADLCRLGRGTTHHTPAAFGMEH